MAEKGLISKSTMIEIADAIRSKTGSSGQMSPSEMGFLIESIITEPTLQNKTVTPSTSKQSVTADSGYDGLNTVTVNAIPSSYVKPTSTKGAATYTPTTTTQTIAAGTYCSGKQTILGDANLIAENILSGKSIFGVVGSASAGAKIKMGEIDTSEFDTSITITHGLGVTPNFAAIYKKDLVTVAADDLLIPISICRDDKYSELTGGASINTSDTGLIGGRQGITWDSQTVTFMSTSYSMSEYTYVDTTFYGGYTYIIAAL